MTAAVESDGMEWVFAGLVAGKVCVAKESYGSTILYCKSDSVPLLNALFFTHHVFEVDTKVPHAFSRRKNRSLRFKNGL